MKPARSAVVADDHPVVRAAVKILLKQEGFHPIHEVSSGNEVFSAIREHQPDLVVLDLMMPRLGGLEVLARIQASDERCRVLVFTGQDPRFYQDRCMRAGAVAYVSKSNDLQHLHEAVHAVMAGYTYFAKLPSSSVALSTLQCNEKEMIHRLSDRELTILVYLAKGLGNKEIAELMNLSPKTTSTYKTRLKEKLNVESNVHLSHFARRHELI
ncbi:MULTISPECIES: response regulator transcription factor [Pseudomonas]|jgi:two-component system response regulator EvgA|uniref:LuxR family transcriptional regulator n=1 Tax=Pseudomonas fluorescens NCIMB 11764 TaxID=1221522 RepID=A0A0K1QVW2_PSEFL|nr:response regulator transcription factor [Pseudomonas fluorescens]AKV09896.1 LuxR family transcriptional regulator [Pseudomonas fluorescens NCIMB 11764]MDZ4326834.1 response regulator transcription factor [Pseudomonas sp.]